jgi:RHS repeat-associated protein
MTTTSSLGHPPSIKSLVALPGGGVAAYTATGPSYYHSDHLGSFRLGSTSTRTVAFDLAYAPFGETYAVSGTTDIAFTGQRQDTSTGLYDFPAREYSIQGRWPSPDPAGRKAVSLSNPQSWNRYAYVTNNPLRLFDPLGLDGCFENAVRPRIVGQLRIRFHRRVHALDDCGDGGGGGGGGAIDSGGDTVGPGATDPPTEDPNVPGPSDANVGTGPNGLVGSMIGGVFSWTNITPSEPNPLDNLPLGPSYADDVLQQLAPGVVQGAGALNDPSTYLVWYGGSAAIGAVYSIVPLYEASLSLYSSIGNAYIDVASNIGTWQTFDPIGYGEAVDFIGNVLPTPPWITSTGAGAVMGVLGSKAWNGLKCVITGEECGW